MAGLILLAFVGLWLWAAVAITSWVVKLFDKKFKILFSVFIFPIVVVLPFLDEIIGRIQFKKICDTEAKVWVTPNIKEIKAAHYGYREPINISGNIIPIWEKSSIYVDAYTGKEIYKYRAFYTSGGWIMRNGLGMGKNRSCWPENWGSKANGFNIDKLLKRGEKISARY